MQQLFLYIIGYFTIFYELQLNYCQSKNKKKKVTIKGREWEDYVEIYSCGDNIYINIKKRVFYE